MQELMDRGLSGAPCSSPERETPACKDGDFYSTLTYVSWPTLIISTLAAGGFLYKGFTAESRPAGESSVRRGPRFVVAPHILPDSAGATLLWRF
jgi:hypothetical protein